jgi:hypothetical protein
MSITHRASCADANECSFTPRAEASDTLGYRFLIIFVLSILSWAALVAIMMALVQAMCALLRLIAQKHELCDAVSRFFASF